MTTYDNVFFLLLLLFPILITAHKKKISFGLYEKIEHIFSRPGVWSYGCIHSNACTKGLWPFTSAGLHKGGCLITGWCLVGAMFTLHCKILTSHYDCKMNLILKATYKIQLTLQLSSLNWIQQGQKLYPQILFTWMQNLFTWGGEGEREANKIQRYLIPRHWWIIYYPYSSSSNTWS